MEPGYRKRCHVEDVLDWALVVPANEVSPDDVTMYSQVMLRDLETDDRSTLTLCYPAHANPDANLVSVLSPVGWSLLGNPVATNLSMAANNAVCRAALLARGHDARLCSPLLGTRAGRLLDVCACKGGSGCRRADAAPGGGDGFRQPRAAMCLRPLRPEAANDPGAVRSRPAPTRRVPKRG